MEKELKTQVTQEHFITLINSICIRRNIPTQLKGSDTPFQIIVKLNKILVAMKLIKMVIGFNVLDEAIEKIIVLDKEELSGDEYIRLYVYFYFYNSISKLEEMPPQFDNDEIVQIMIKTIQGDIMLKNTYSFLGGELLLNK